MGIQENLCKARGCDKCCHSPFLGMSFENFRLFESAVKERGVDVDLQTAESFRLIQALIPGAPGIKLVVYCTDHNQDTDVLVQIVGTCIFLTDGNCNIIEKPARPSGCDGIAFDGSICERITSGSFTFISADTIV